MRPGNIVLNSLSKTGVGRKQFEPSCGRVSSHQSISGIHVEIVTNGTGQMMLTAVGKFQEVPISINSEHVFGKDGERPLRVGDVRYVRGTGRPQWGYKVMPGPHIP